MKENSLYEASLSYSTTLSYKTTIQTIMEAASPRLLPQKDTGIVDSGATHFFIAPSAPHGPLNTIASPISVCTATGRIERSSETATLPIPQLAAEFTTTGYIMPSFTNKLVGVGPICDADCTLLFTKKYVTVLSPGGKPILTGRREKELPRLWRFALKPTKELLLHHTTKRQTTLSAYSAYNLPLVRYMHATSGLPVKSTWLRAIKKRNFETWPRLTYSNAEKYCPHAVETIKGHMVQSSQGVRSTNKKAPPPREIKKVIFKLAPEE